MCVCGRACVCVIGMAAGSCVYVCVCVLSVSITSVPGILQRHSLSKALLSCILDPQCVCVCVHLCVSVHCGPAFASVQCIPGKPM